MRTDLSVVPQKYEGRTYYIVKDPVSLHYYRYTEQEHFLLTLMDGATTLDQAQQAFEQRFRPHRVTLPEVEGFAQQLLTTGLAHAESPQADKQLYQRRREQRRGERLQLLSNLLYIKVPLFDPDRLLGRLLPYLRWIFTTWFMLVSMGMLLAALLLVATHFDAFLDRLPASRELFNFKTLLSAWLAYAVVKVIHEFGHGLSCKAFGGEVHETGALFLCFTPCLYVNASDAWTLPDKWKRIIVSFAGIYVELIIAALATVVWWNTPGQPFVNSLALGLMVVCSINTVAFNGNPLLRYDGYYMLADWLEVPNLRGRASAFLKHLVGQHCLGIQAPAEPYMAAWRRLLFVNYAVLSYVYTWIVTYGILWLLHSLFKPYGLEAISNLLACGAVVSMVAWPLYRLGKNLGQRGRLPRMSLWRVLASSRCTGGDRGLHCPGAVAGVPGVPGGPGAAPARRLREGLRADVRHPRTIARARWPAGREGGPARRVPQPRSRKPVGAGPQRARHPRGAAADPDRPGRSADRRARPCPGRGRDRHGCRGARPLRPPSGSVREGEQATRAGAPRAGVVMARRKSMPSASSGRRTAMRRSARSAIRPGRKR